MSHKTENQCRDSFLLGQPSRIKLTSNSTPAILKLSLNNFYDDYKYVHLINVNFTSNIYTAACGFSAVTNSQYNKITLIWKKQTKDSKLTGKILQKTYSKHFWLNAKYNFVNVMYYIWILTENVKYLSQNSIRFYNKHWTLEHLTNSIDFYHFYTGRVGIIEW